MKKQYFSVVGKRLPRIDASSKATGEAIYTIDMQLPRMLCGKILRSPHGHAKILNIDTSRAERLPGVKDVITWKDLKPEKKSHHCYGAFIPDEYPLAIDRVRFIGDEVAAVAAVDEDTACQALDLIRVDYEPLAAVFDPEAALGEGARSCMNMRRIIRAGGFTRIWVMSNMDLKRPAISRRTDLSPIFNVTVLWNPTPPLPNLGPTANLRCGFNPTTFLCPGTLPRQWIYRKVAFV